MSHAVVIRDRLTRCAAAGQRVRTAGWMDRLHREMLAASRRGGAETSASGYPLAPTDSVGASTVQFQWIDDSTFQFTVRRRGAVRVTSRGFMAAHGRTRRSVVMGWSTEGKPFRNVEAYRKR